LPTRTAILGAGGVGVCAALELARRGRTIDLYDESSRPVTRASLHNEGKIHLGLVYARDRSLRTARTMLFGAINFRSCLKRWIDIDPVDVTLSTPYYYGVHEGTMTSVEELRRHYDRCKKLLEDACSSTGLSYLGGERTLLAEEIPRREMEALLAGEYFLTAFRTTERAVDPRVVADLLRAAVFATPRIRFVANAHVSGVTRSDTDSLRVSFRLDGEEYEEEYDHVVNSLWHGRLEIDAKLGIAPERGWIHRYKLGGWINTPIGPETVPSVTAVLGPFGDLVNLGRRGAYFSWYPAGMIGTSHELKPPEWDLSLSSARRQAILRRSYDEWLKRCPGLRSLEYSDGVVAPAGGVIFAWGATDIHDDCSRLHTRSEIGIHSVGNYHSVNTGKYSMTPYLGYKVAERVLDTT
jgi:FAD dependent oxidoreductase